jgi:hypothetical protein
MAGFSLLAGFTSTLAEGAVVKGEGNESLRCKLLCIHGWYLLFYTGLRTNNNDGWLLSRGDVSWQIKVSYHFGITAFELDFANGDFFCGSCLSHSGHSGFSRSLRGNSAGVGRSKKSNRSEGECC